MATIRVESVAMAREMVASNNTTGASGVIKAARAKRGLIAQITQHWFRHALATQMLSNGADRRTVMEQSGWLDPNSVIGYAHDGPARRREFVNRIANSDVG